MKQLLSKLTSRKFLLALSAFIAALAHSNIPAAVAVVLGYLGAEGYTDGKSAGNSGN